MKRDRAEEIIHKKITEEERKDRDPLVSAGKLWAQLDGAAVGKKKKIYASYYRAAAAVFFALICVTALITYQQHNRDQVSVKTDKPIKQVQERPEKNVPEIVENSTPQKHVIEAQKKTYKKASVVSSVRETNEKTIAKVLKQVGKNDEFDIQDPTTFGLYEDMATTSPCYKEDFPTVN